LSEVFSRILFRYALKGGMTGVRENGRRFRTRAVKSIDRDKKLNKALWILTEEMARQKQ